MVFQYPTQPHYRRHGPQGYADYRSFKPWLRDEFTFRCVYCLWRENWCADGDDSFGVEHLHARATQPDRVCDYENLLYACCRCNSLKQDAPPVLDPCEHAWGDHFVVEADGTLKALTSDAERVIEVCRLNRGSLVDARRRIMLLLETLSASKSETARALLRFYRGFPENLPDLATLKPPGGNTRPDGIAASYYQLRLRDELAESY